MSGSLEVGQTRKWDAISGHTRPAGVGAGALLAAARRVLSGLGRTGVAYRGGGDARLKREIFDEQREYPTEGA